MTSILRPTHTASLVGGVGIATVMMTGVLERRSEIGLRRALGAARRHVGAEFLADSARRERARSFSPHATQPVPGAGDGRLG
jgi:FtsX-like permease family